jgi:hypothetical protein
MAHWAVEGRSESDASTQALSAPGPHVFSPLPGGLRRSAKTRRSPPSGRRWLMGRWKDARNPMLRRNRYRHRGPTCSHRCRAAYAAPLKRVVHRRGRLPPSGRRWLMGWWKDARNPMLRRKRCRRRGHTYSHHCRAAYAAPLKRVVYRRGRLPPTRRRWLVGRWKDARNTMLRRKRRRHRGHTYSLRCRAAYAAPLKRVVHRRGRSPPCGRRWLMGRWKDARNPMLRRTRCRRRGHTYSHRCRAAYAAPLKRVVHRRGRLPPCGRRWLMGRWKDARNTMLRRKRCRRRGHTYSHRCRAAYAAPLKRVVHRRGRLPPCGRRWLVRRLKDARNPMRSRKRCRRRGHTCSHRCRAAYAAPLKRVVHRRSRLPPCGRRWLMGRWKDARNPMLRRKRCRRRGHTYSHHCRAAYAAPLKRVVYRRGRLPPTRRRWLVGRWKDARNTMLRRKRRRHRGHTYSLRCRAAYAAPLKRVVHRRGRSPPCGRRWLVGRSEDARRVRFRFAVEPAPTAWR